MLSATALLLLPALVLAGPVNRRQAPNPEEIQIIETGHSGNGCPQGTVSTLISEDRTVVTFGFDAFQAYIGPNTSPADHSKNCQLHLQLQYPGGFQYSILDATYHGYARLDEGVTGTFFSTYFFSRSAADTSSTRTSISGPEWLEGDIYTKSDQVENTAVVWSPCGAEGMLNINNRIALTSRDREASGALSNDDATVAFTHQLHVAWRTCDGEDADGGHDDIGLGDVVSNIHRG
ncbi:hypothetical protein AJ79_05074 [Helicocarpus griseus UAMH5409]|uniref:DUF4360 domain-containing protein n=1 Tax=Helicocarpus griseus UAMH5409 TaxID=1447875 RepID=A0A2B7XRK2_9EURO|nr:hypothetical protein AJ79_05074 [Helicocarpus griseus UAMH5409]